MVNMGGKFMEKYLKEEYNVIEDERFLTSESEIEDYFKDVGTDYLDCGQGYYQDEAEVICKVLDKFYKVKIKASIDSAKQDYGDRLYWIDKITSVIYEEIEKPQPKKRVSVTYNLNINEEQKTALEYFMKQNYIEF